MQTTQDIFSKYDGCSSGAKKYFSDWIRDQFDGDFDSWQEDVYVTSTFDDRLGLEVPVLEVESSNWYYHPIKNEWMDEMEFEDSLG